MTIHHFAAHQNDVFVPALAAALVATVLLVLPVVFAPAVRRAQGGRAFVAVSLVVAAAALVVAGWQAGVGFRTLVDERARVAAELRSTYGLALDGGEVGELVDGGKVEVPRFGTRKLQFRSDGGDTYTLLLAGKPLTPQA